MAHDHNLAIFRGKLKFKSNEHKIWGVFIFLSIVTIVEVVLGIIKPGFFNEAFHHSVLKEGFGATLMNIILSPLGFSDTIKFNFLSVNHSKSLLHYLGFHAHER